MIKRGMSAVAAVLVVVLAFAGTAAAQSSEPLRYKTAKKLALRLAEKQVADRDVDAYHVYDAERLNRNSIAFAYDDRVDERFCTAVLLVTQRITSADGDRRIRARFRSQECMPIPDDALAAEAATRAAVRSLRGTRAETLASLRRVTRSLRRCENIDFPRTRRAHVNAIIDIAIVQAIVGPNDAILGEFATALDAIDTTNQVLERGIGGWADWLATIRSLPPIPDPCATLREWDEANWSASAAPIDLAAYRTLDRRANADRRAIRRAGRYLREVGVFRRLVRAFTPDGMILRVAEIGAGDG